MTRLEAAGEIRTEGTTHPVSGEAWMDHEFSTSILGEDQEGWDWFALQLDDGRELMLYQMRKRDGSIDRASSGSLIERDGRVVSLKGSEFSIVPTGSWRSARSGAVYPMGWTVAVPRLAIELEVREAMKDQELVTTSSTGVTYWEGAVTAKGARLSGVGYVEMTGYAAPFDLGP
jgi:predicted secreted hydrolase